MCQRLMRAAFSSRSVYNTLDINYRFPLSCNFEFVLFREGVFNQQGQSLKHNDNTMY